MVLTIIILNSHERYTKELRQDIKPGGGGNTAIHGQCVAGMCRCEGYGFQAVYSKIGYINQSVWV